MLAPLASRHPRAARRDQRMASYGRNRLPRRRLRRGRATRSDVALRGSRSLRWRTGSRQTRPTRDSDVLERPVRTISAAWGRVRVTEEALVFALSVHTALVRRGDGGAELVPAAPRGAALPTRADVEPPVATSAPVATFLAEAALFGVAAGAGAPARRRIGGPRATRGRRAVDLAGVQCAARGRGDRLGDGPDSTPIRRPRRHD
jgi:hypothetical protein